MPDGTGNVGIGTTGPGAELEVSGDILLQDDLRIADNSSFDAHTAPNPQFQDSLQFKTTHTGTGNEYTYLLIFDIASYTIASGDYLEYDVFSDISNVSCSGGTEIEGTSPATWEGRGLSLVDQHSISNNAGDVSSYANGHNWWTTNRTYKNCC